MPGKLPQHITDEIRLDLDRGENAATIAQKFSVSKRTIERLRLAFDLFNQPYCPSEGRVGRPRAFTVAQEEFIMDYMNSNPAALLDELTDVIYHEFQIACAPTTAWRVLNDHKWSRKEAKERAGQPVPQSRGQSRTEERGEEWSTTTQHATTDAMDVDVRMPYPPAFNGSVMNTTVLPSNAVDTVMMENQGLPPMAVASPMERFRRRKVHSKSRTGCSQCKKRHQKCDEVAPRCGNCVRLNSFCGLESSAQTPAESTIEIPALAIDDFRLLHNWNKGIDGLTFSDREANPGENGDPDMVELGFSRPYLLHVILSISALNMFSKNPTERHYYEQASSHHLAAVRLARPHISKHEAEHKLSLHFFSGLNSLYAIAEPPFRALSTENSGSQDWIDEILRVFRMGGAIVSLMESSPPEQKPGKKAQKTVWKDNGAEVAKTLDADFPQMLGLQRLIVSQCEEPQRSACLQAVRDLFIFIGVLHTNPENHSSLVRLMTWSMHFDHKVITMIVERQPVALVMLAHYAAMMSLRSNAWFFGRWPRLLMESIEGLLDENFKRHLQWPRTVVREGLEKPRGVIQAAPIVEAPHQAQSQPDRLIASTVAYLLPHDLAAI